MIKKYLIILFILVCNQTYSQALLYSSQAKVMQISNPSYYGLNSWNRTGLLYSTTQVNLNQIQNNKFFYGSLSFDNLNFSLGFGVNNFSAPQIGLKKNQFDLSYIYKVEFGSDIWFLPAVTLGATSRNINQTDLIFEDQINSITGYINQESIDDLANLFFGTNYADLGASFILHSQDFLIGISFKHLNQPNIAFDQSIDFIQPITMGAQLAYEYNLNPYDRRFLPRYSYLYAYGSVLKDKESMNIYLSQEFVLGEFSAGINQQFGLIDAISFLNVGLNIGLQYENFDFGVSYSFAFQDTAVPTSYRYAPTMFDLHLSFDFSPFLRNRRGQYKRLQVDNYY
jgi:type IX secretion system PorP/SprF family membrane protein